MNPQPSAEQLAQRIQQYIEHGKSPSVLVAQLLDEGLGFILPMVALRQLTRSSIKDMKELGMWFDQERRITNTNAFDKHFLSLFSKP